MNKVKLFRLPMLFGLFLRISTHDKELAFGLTVCFFSDYILRDGSTPIALTLYCLNAAVSIGFSSDLRKG